MRTLVLSLLLLAQAALGLLRAGVYTPQNLPMVYLADRTRHVVNPDALLSNAAVAHMDSLLLRLEQERGVQSVVAVVEAIEGADCYSFALSLGNSRGIGNSQNTGLIILLATQDRCYYILTGEGLEGSLPDAICRRIENRYMVPHLKARDWDTAMQQTVEAVCAQLLHDEGLLPQAQDDTADDDMTFVWLLLAFFLAVVVAVAYQQRKESTCPRCGHRPLKRINSTTTTDRVRRVRHHTETFTCTHCGYTVQRERNEPFDNGTGFGGVPPIIGPGGFGRRGGGFGGSIGGSFGGGSFGGGGAGGRF